jgi:hypothetical protein
MGDRPLRPDSSLPGRPAGTLRPRRGRRGLRCQLSGHDRGAVLARLASACHLERSQGMDGGHHLRLRALPGIASATAHPGLFVEDSATTRVGTPSGIESPWKLPERRASVGRSRREGVVDIGEPERTYTVEPLEDPVPREPLEPPDEAPERAASRASGAGSPRSILLPLKCVAKTAISDGNAEAEESAGPTRPDPRPAAAGAAAVPVGAPRRRLFALADEARLPPPLSPHRAGAPGSQWPPSCRHGFVRSTGSAGAGRTRPPLRSPPARCAWLPHFLAAARA